MLAIAIQWTKRTTFISLAPILTRILAIFVFSLLENYSLEFFIVCLYIVINHALPNPLKSGSWPNISLSLSLALGNIGHIEPLFPFWTSFIPSFWDSTLSWSSSSFCYASVLALLTVSPIHPLHFLRWPTLLPIKSLLTPTSKGLWHPAPTLFSNLLYYSSPTVVYSLTKQDFLLFSFYARGFPITVDSLLFPFHTRQKSY